MIDYELFCVIDYSNDDYYYHADRPSADLLLSGLARHERVAALYGIAAAEDGGFHQVLIAGWPPQGEQFEVSENLPAAAF